MRTIEQWAIITTADHHYPKVWGRTGTRLITTSAIVRLDGAVITTRSGSKYRLGEARHRDTADRLAELAKHRPMYPSVDAAPKRAKEPR